MDVVAVRAMAAEFRRAVDRFRQVGIDVTNEVAASWWEGRDADAFRRAWSSQRLTLQDAATALSEAREQLVRQAHDQEVASRGDGVPAAGPGTAALFGPLEDWAVPVGKDLHGVWERLREEFGQLGEKVQDGFEDLGRVLTDLGGDAVCWLEWLSGPDGPSTEDATTLLPGLQRLIGMGGDVVMKIPPFNVAISALGGFEYVPGKDFYTTNETSIQSHVGFHDLYDRLHKLGGMDLDDKVVEFSADGKQYRLELWKGGYMSGGGFGGEIGLYTRRPDSNWARGLLEKIPGYYSSAQGEDQIPMSQTIFDKQTGEVYFTNDGQGTSDGEHYWNLAIRSDPGIRREDLGQRGTLHVADPDVRTAMADAMRQQGLTPVVDESAGTVSYEWNG